MNDIPLPVNGVGVVNARGEVAIVIEPLPEPSRPTGMRQTGNRIAVVSGVSPVSVRAYGENTAAALAAKGVALVVEIDPVTQKVVRATEVAVGRD